MNDMSAVAHDRLIAQIAEALFGQPGMSLMEMANRRAEIEALVKDAGRYRWISENAGCSLSISHNDHHNVYQTVQDTLDDSQGYYDEIQPDERELMIQSDTIWTVQEYPNTPIGFNVWHAASLSAAIDAAMKEKANDSAKA